MQGKITIKKDGTVISEVLDRENQDCKKIFKLIEHIGKTVDEEITGPDCDSAQETTI